jgi:Tfp pilus assembly PilM family ATPase
VLRKGIIGLDIGTTSMKAVHLKGKRIINTQIIEYPRPLKIGRDEDAPIITDLLRQTLKGKGRIALSLSRDECIVEMVDLPTKDPDRIQNIIHLNISEYILIPLRDLYVGWEILETEDNKARVMIVATKKDLLNRYLDIIHHAGLSLSFVLPKFLTYGILEDRGTVAFLEIGVETTTLTILKHKRFLFSTSIKDLKRGLIERLQNSFRAFSIQYQEERVEKMLVFGEGALEKDVVEGLSEEFDLEVEVLKDPRLVNALCAARGAMEGGMNLLPDKRRRPWRLKRAASLLLSTPLLLLLIYLNVENLMKQRALDRIEEELKRTEAKVSGLRTMRSRHGITKKIEILNELNRIIPEGVWLSSLLIEEGMMRISGKALEEEEVADLFSLMERSPILKDVILLSTRREPLGQREIIEFEITCKLGRE